MWVLGLLFHSEYPSLHDGAMAFYMGNHIGTVKPDIISEYPFRLLCEGILPVGDGPGGIVMGAVGDWAASES